MGSDVRRHTERQPRAAAAGVRLLVAVVLVLLVGGVSDGAPQADLANERAAADEVDRPALTPGACTGVPEIVTAWTGIYLLCVHAGADSHPG